MSIEFDDLEVEVSRCLCKKLEVRVLGSPFDRPREPFAPPYDLDGLTARLEALDSLLLKRNTPKIASQRRNLATDIGRELYEALLPGNVGKTFARCVSAVEATRENRDVGLRIRISFGEANRYLPEIVGLPWELLCDPESLQFPGSEPQSPIVRYLDISKRVRPLQISPPLKVLAILSSPKSTDELRLSPIDIPKHKEILRRAMRNQKWLKMHFLKHASLTELRETLGLHRDQKRPFHALHFLGHGEFDDSGEGILYFEGSNREPEPVSGRSLAKQLAGFDELRLAVLATCVGARMMRRAGQHPFTGAASALIARGLPAVVAMQFSITEAAATQFTSCFYDKIAAGRPVDVAVTEGRLKMATHGADSFEWACPVLFLRTPDGQILDIQEEEVPVKKIAVFNVRDHGKDDVDVNDYEVDLTDFFELREDRPGIHRAHIRDPKLWNTGVMEALTDVFNRDLFQDAAYRLVIAAPISVAFAAGYLMHTRAAHRLVFPQRGHHGISGWRFEGQVTPQAAKWLPDVQAREEIPPDLPLDETSPDVAAIVEPSRPVLPAVQTYLRQSSDAPCVSHIFYAKLDRGSGQSTVENGAHAYQLAEELCNLVHAHTSAKPAGTVHWFISAPTTFVFALGRLSRCFSATQLYEFDLGRQGAGSGTYEPSIALPPNLRPETGA